MRKPWTLVTATLLLLTLLPNLAPADDDKPESDKPASSTDKPKTVKVQKGEWAVEATLKGVFEAEDSTELFLRPEAWSQPFEVKSALKHGEAVKKGDVVATFDSEKIDREIDDLFVQFALSELSVKLAQHELPIFEKLLPIELATAEREAKIAEQDLQKFLDVDRELSEQQARFSVKSGQQRLKYSREELKQLQDMYRDKDLTEETEEMILQRQRFEVESAEFYLKIAENNAEKTLKVELPRKEQLLKDTAIKSAINLERTQKTQPLNLDQKRLALKKEEFDLVKTRERLADLRHDRHLFEIKAPVNGVVYYGQATDGVWTAVAQEEKKLSPGGKIPADQVFMTIVQPRPLWVRVKVDEKDLHKLSSKPKGEISPTGFPALSLEGQVESLSAVPSAPGQFIAKIEIELTDDAEMLMPGMTCKFSMREVLLDNALSLPASAVFRDAPGSPWYVYRPSKNGDEPSKTVVKLGRRDADRVQILDGLSEDDEVLSKKPE